MQGQQFAVVFATSHDRIEKAWAKQQLKLRERKISAVETSTSTVVRTRGQESARPSSSTGDRSSSSESSSSTTGPGTSSSPLEDQGDLDGGSELKDGAISIEELNGGCSATAVAIDVAGLAREVVEVVESGDSFDPAKGITPGSEGDSQDETDRATATKQNQDGKKEAAVTDEDYPDGRAMVAAKHNNTRKGNDDATAVVRGDDATKEIPLQGPFYSDELLDISDTECSCDDDSSDRRRRKNLHRYLTDGCGWPPAKDASDDDAAAGGDSIEPQETDREKRAVLSWIVSRMGLLEKVLMSPVL